MRYFRFNIGNSSGYVDVEANTAAEAKAKHAGNSNGDALVVCYQQHKQTFICVPLCGEPRDVTDEYYSTSGAAYEP